MLQKIEIFLRFSICEKKCGFIAMETKLAGLEGIAMQEMDTVE